MKYLVWIPKKLKSSEKDALESMRQSESFVPNLSREDKNLFDKMKENFKICENFVEKVCRLKNSSYLCNPNNKATSYNR